MQSRNPIKHQPDAVGPPVEASAQRHDSQPLEPSPLTFGDLPLPRYQQQQQEEQEQKTMTPQLAQKLPPMGIFKAPRKRRQSQLPPSDDTSGRLEDVGTAGHAPKRQRRDKVTSSVAPNAMKVDDKKVYRPFQGQQRQRYGPQTRWTAINITRDANGFQITTSFSFPSQSRPGSENDQEQKAQQQREEEEEQRLRDRKEERKRVAREKARERRKKEKERKQEKKNEEEQEKNG